MRILVAEADALIARQIVHDIRTLGDSVVGPFATASEALRHVGDAQGAILDIERGQHASFTVADALRDRHSPIVFLTGPARARLPVRFRTTPVHRKPWRMRSLLSDLHVRRMRGPGPDGVDAIMGDMLAYARLRMGDRAAAERLVEAVMHAAIDRVRTQGAVSDLRALLGDLLEHRIVAGPARHLH